MRAGAVAFPVGILLLVSLPNLPDTLFVGFLPVLVLFAVFSPRSVRVLAWLGMGFLWALFRAGVDLANPLPATLENRDLVVVGVVASLPVRAERKTGFLLDVIRVEDPSIAWGRGQRIRLNWYRDAPRLLPGERWRLTVRLKRPRGFHNPGGFDYEKWLFRQGVRATGYVRWAEGNGRIAAGNRMSPDRVRHGLAVAISEAFGDSTYAGIAKALAIGVRDGVTTAQWTTLRATGVAHLMAISGLHIGLVTLLIFFVARRLWTVLPDMALMIPAQRLAAPVAMASALGYAALAGFSLPTQRALVMVCVVMAGIFWRRHTLPSFSLALALLAILVLDPFSVLSMGFWLSFAAVAVILFGMTGRPALRPVVVDDSSGHGGGTGQIGVWAKVLLRVRELWWRWGRVQVVIAIGLVPLTMLFFHQHPLIGPLANLVAIPWIGLVAIPLLLAGTCLITLLPDAGGLLLNGGAWAIAALWPFLEALESWDFVYRQSLALPLWTVVAGGIGVFLLLMPRGMPGRWLGVVWLLPLFLTPPPRPPEGAVWFTLLDVGQGLAAVVRTREHVLVYDTGPAYGPSFDAGRAVIAPFLRSRGIESVDRVVVSHEDADHAGGLRSLLAEFPVDRLFANTLMGNGHADRQPAIDSLSKRKPTKNIALRSTCRDGVEWRWDGVDFRFLHPPSGKAASGNNGSCVLAITNTEGTILLTGDIEQTAERRLVQNHGDRLRADILVAPHHGSDSSSSETFLTAARPRYALFSVGYRNRFGLPSGAVVARYRQAGARLLFSDRDGAIGFQLTPGRGVSPPTLHRAERRYFWHDDFTE
uniref:Competence protein ComEC n=1 Tax=Candidatus Kentrum eta TaxID=2126337 RepID=A0A450VL71_9GAMM|nr:MAG: competence protein ComEC [Candidatus Kentron sp. H]VFK02502.1 MAG: competence protein ComEC [Candidatus Kentron sp. H]VFK05539.1 MAG: competence protein ComEC [Candidatus Kentron sp. H]